MIMSNDFDRIWWITLFRAYAKPIKRDKWTDLIKIRGVN